MKNTLLLAVTLLCCATWMAAQSSSNPGGSTSTGQMNSGQNQTTIQGCLTSSSGNYVITDSSGTQYQLSGNTANLSSHANQQVKVKGVVSGSDTSTSGTGTQGTGTATTAGSAQTFHVSKVTKISDSCSTGK
jgi:hypothetical protein